MSILETTLEHPPLTAKPSGPVRPMGLEPIHSQRVGLKIFQSGFYTHQTRERLKASWPIGKLCLYRDHATVGSFMRTYQIEYTSIERITTSMLFYVRIDHTCPDVPDVVLLNGWFLMKTLRNVVRANLLRLRIE